MPSIALFIPHHKNPALLPPLLNSLRRLKGHPRDTVTILVDNHAQDGSVELVNTHYPEVRVHSLEKNEGFAPALNRAVQAHEAEWVCFLNNDVRADPLWLQTLIQATEQVHASCFASHIINWIGTQTQFAGGWINLFGKGFENPQIQGEEPYEIFFPCGCGMLIRRDLFLQMGGFDDEYFMLYEDVDLGWRLRLAGHPIFLVPQARLMHRAHASLANEAYARKAVYYERNSLATIYKNYETATLNLIFPLAVREILLRAQAVSGIGLPFRYGSDGMAMRQAVADFLANRAHWEQKRTAVQALRQVADAELFARFFPHPTQPWCYAPAHYERMHHPQILSQIETCFTLAKQAIHGLGLEGQGEAGNSLFPVPAEESLSFVSDSPLA